VSGHAPGEDRAISLRRHELRTPVNHIIGYADLLAEDATELGLATRLDALHSIGALGRQVLELVDEIAAAEEPAALRGRLLAALGAVLAACDALESDAGGDDAAGLRRDLAKVRAACDRLESLTAAPPPDELPPVA